MIDDQKLPIEVHLGRLCLVLTFRHTVEFRLPYRDIDGAVIGRWDSKRHFRPAIDLADIQAKMYGVSRQHARLSFRQNLIFIEDYNSLNGTFLNGQRLFPNYQRVLRNDDTLRLGALNLKVTFE